MIGRIWEELFRYADDLKAREEWEKYVAVREIEDRLLEIWDDAEHFKTRIEKEPQNKIEEIVLSIPGLEVFRDPRDKKFFLRDGRETFRQTGRSDPGADKIPERRKKKGNDTNEDRNI